MKKRNVIIAIYMIELGALLSPIVYCWINEIEMLNGNNQTIGIVVLSWVVLVMFIASALIHLVVNGNFNFRKWIAGLM